MLDERFSETRRGRRQRRVPRDDGKNLVTDAAAARGAVRPLAVRYRRGAMSEESNYFIVRAEDRDEVGAELAAMRLAAQVENGNDAGGAGWVVVGHPRLTLAELGRHFRLCAHIEASVDDGHITFSVAGRTLGPRATSTLARALNRSASDVRAALRKPLWAACKALGLPALPLFDQRELPRTRTKRPKTSLLRRIENSGYRSDGERVVYVTDKHEAIELPIHDAAHFEVLAYDCARDDAHVFCGGVVLGADAKTFELLGDYARDRHHVYHRMRVLERAKPHPFRVSGPYGWDDTRVWHDGAACPDADARTFEPLPSAYARDARHVYFRGARVEGATPARLLVHGRYAVDGQHVLYDGVALPEADARTFAVDRDGVHARDKTNRYAYGRVVRTPKPLPSATGSLSNRWRTCAAWLAEERPDLLARFNPPATDAALAAAEKALATPLPAEYVELLRLFNGQERDDGSDRNLKFTVLGPLLRVERLAEIKANMKKHPRSKKLDALLPIAVSRRGTDFVCIDPNAGGAIVLCGVHQATTRYAKNVADLVTQFLENAQRGRV